MKEVKIEPVFVATVSFMLVAIDSCAPFGSELVGMAVQKLGYPALRNLQFCNCAAQILHNLSCR
jgi:hypothetical protein